VGLASVTALHRGAWTGAAFPTDVSLSLDFGAVLHPWGLCGAARRTDGRAASRVRGGPTG
jgi:hypothetical protein